MDLCFLVDCTGSMKPWIEAVKDTVKTLETKMKDQYKQCTMRFAFVRYTDYDQPLESRVTYIDFTKLAYE